MESVSGEEREIKFLWWRQGHSGILVLCSTCNSAGDFRTKLLNSGRVKRNFGVNFGAAERTQRIEKQSIQSSGTSCHQKIRERVVEQ